MAAPMDGREVAQYLRVSRQRVDQLAQSSGFPQPKVVAGRRTWSRTTIERWARAHWWGTKPWRLEG
jgi:predicted DNA-binding transcriptional regulator AlpA